MVHTTATITLVIWMLLCTGSESWLTAVFAPRIVLPAQNLSSPHGDLDLLDVLNISTDLRGISQAKSSHEGGKAYRFHTAFDHVQVSEREASEWLSQLDKQLSAEFVYRQHRKTVATLLTINSPGKMSPWFRITSNTKFNKLFVYYRIEEDTKLHEKIFDLHRNGENWTHVGVSVNGTRMVVFLDCSFPDKQLLAGNIYLKFPRDSLIYFRQEPGFKKKFLGSIELARISSSARNIQSWDCPSTPNRRRRAL